MIQEPNYIKNLHTAILHMLERVQKDNATPWLGPKATLMINGFHKSHRGINLLILNDFRVQNSLNSYLFHAYNSNQPEEGLYTIGIRDKKGDTLVVYTHPSYKVKDHVLTHLRNEQQLYFAKLRAEMKHQGLVPSNNRVIGTFLYRKSLEFFQHKYGMVQASAYTNMRLIAEIAATAMAIEMNLNKHVECENIRCLSLWAEQLKTHELDMCEIALLTEQCRNAVARQIQKVDIVKEDFSRDLSLFMKERKEQEQQTAPKLHRFQDISTSFNWRKK